MFVQFSCWLRPAWASFRDGVCRICTWTWGADVLCSSRLEFSFGSLFVSAWCHFIGWRVSWWRQGLFRCLKCLTNPVVQRSEMSYQLTNFCRAFWFPDLRKVHGPPGLSEKCLDFCSDAKRVETASKKQSSTWPKGSTCQLHMMKNHRHVTSHVWAGTQIKVGSCWAPILRLCLGE